MIRRIQQFTTQSMPVATIGGLEPKSPQPKMFAHAPAGRAVAARARAGRRAPRRSPTPRRRSQQRAARVRARGAARGNPFDRALPVRDDRAAPARRPGPAVVQGPRASRSARAPGGFSR